ncbi:MAG: PEGA domain-containing protein, partial [Kofleriaceae bacterium]|nr:PEGA domain-containing protein [Kofleriaceae bacterium]
MLKLLPALLVVTLAVPRVAHADRVVAVTPLSTLGTEDKSATTKKLLGQIEQAIARLPGTKVITSSQVASAIDKAKKPGLKQCEGEPTCVTEVGKLVGAQLVITGEVGGLGDSRVIYLKTTDVGAARELRSTTLALGAANAADTPMGAAIRLLDPDKYRGTVRFNFDVSGATVLVNGTKVQPNATREIALPVGTHAVTVTHPQYHNFVKFVDVDYG